MKYCVLYLISVVSLPVFSQNSNDTLLAVPKNNQIQVSISIDDLNTLNTENDTLKFQLSKLTQMYHKLQSETAEDKRKLSKFEAEVRQLKNDTTKLYSAQREADKRLVNIASNFLYIPYEAFSIEKIAIPAFKAIANSELRNEHNIKYELLCNYRKDVENLLSFINYASTELQKPFVKNANDIQEQFYSQSFYVTYKNYSEWTNTFLGSKMILIEQQLKNFDGNKHKIDFKSIEQELKNCLKTIEAL